jgi:hypothetical protein
VSFGKVKKMVAYANLYYSHIQNKHLKCQKDRFKSLISEEIYGAFLSKEHPTSKYLLKSQF